MGKARPRGQMELFGEGWEPLRGAGLDGFPMKQGGKAFLLK